MSDILVTVNEQNLHITNAPKIAAQGVNENYLVLTFSSEWDDFGKSVLFYREEDENTVYESAVDGDGRALVPHEVTDQDGRICFGVCGVNGDVIYTTEILKYKIVKGRYTAGQETEPPTPGIYEQMLTIAGQMQSLYIELRHDLDAETSVRSAADTELQNNKANKDEINALATDKADKSDLLTLSSRMDNLVADYNLETVEKTIWTGEAQGTGTILTLTDPIADYDYLDVYTWKQGDKPIFTIPAAVTENGADPISLEFPNVADSQNNTQMWIAEIQVSVAASTLTIVKQLSWYWAGTLSNAPTWSEITPQSSLVQYEPYIYKIVGRKIVNNEEVADIRVGADGTVYPSAGAAVRGQVSKINDTLDTYLLDKYTTVNPFNWLDLNAITDGRLTANGTIEASTTHFYTDYIPVEQGNTVRTFRGDQFTPIYRVNICFFDSNKNVMSGGSDSSGQAAYPVPTSAKYVRVTYNKSVLLLNPMIILDGTTPTAYSAYFDPYEKLTEDFITPESSVALTKLKDGLLTSKDDLQNNYARAVPKSGLLQTVGLSESWYYCNVFSPESTRGHISAGGNNTEWYNDRVEFPNTEAVSAVNGFRWQWYDTFLQLIDNYTGPAGYGGEVHIVAENLYDCSLLAIGDSTIDQDYVTRTLLSHFTEKGRTITLLGTLGDGSATNKNEGRAGWSAADYFTNRQYNGVVNPFYNPSTDIFDFAYYMTNQGYVSVDFVVLQLGINDLYNSEYEAIEPTYDYIKEMCLSIHSYDANIKIILNLPTPPTVDQHILRYTNRFLYANRIVKYNEYVISHYMADLGNKVRVSYVHLILDPATDISDTVHPNATGYQKMALEVVNQINCWQNGV